LLRAESKSERWAAVVAAAWARRLSNALPYGAAVDHGSNTAICDRSIATHKRVGFCKHDLDQFSFQSVTESALYYAGQENHACNEGDCCQF
jgi:hypothetical protein